MNTSVKLLIWARKIHRLMLWLVVVTGLVMMATGTIMRFDYVVTAIAPWMPFGAVLTLHRLMAPYFVLVFSVQMLTGLFMYLYPWWIKRRKHTDTQAT